MSMEQYKYIVIDIIDNKVMDYFTKAENANDCAEKLNSSTGNTNYIRYLVYMRII